MEISRHHECFVARFHFGETKDKSLLAIIASRPRLSAYVFFVWTPNCDDMEEIKSQYYYKYDVVHVCKRGPITKFLTKLEWSIIDNMEEYINNMQYALSDLTVYVGMSRWPLL